jgi:hypothetical protein
MSEKITATFDTADDALDALSKLRREGVPDHAITLISSEPIHTEELEDEKPSRIGGFAIAGGLVGAAAAIALTVLVSKQVNINTGGMPVVSPWPFGIVVFEMTALGAIIAALVRMIFEARLARPLADYDASISDGRVVVAVDCLDEKSQSAAQRVLHPHFG